MRDQFVVRDVLRDLAAVRDLLERRAARIAEVGGDPTPTMHHIATLRGIEALLCGRTDVDELLGRLQEMSATLRGRCTHPDGVVVSHSELLKLLDYRAPRCR